MKTQTPHKHRLADATDNELLMLHSRGERLAFTELLNRHAAMVLCVCRRTLRHEQDAEDAFQATFLILARKAARLTTLHSLAAWLHKVARRTAVRAAKRRQQRQAEPLAETASNDQLLEEIHSREMQRVVHQELDRIPSKYRDALVLAYLEGRTREQTAQQLDCSDATVKGLLARGRRHLRLRLLRRGVAFSLAAPLVLVDAQVASASLVEAVVNGCTDPTNALGAGNVAAEASTCTKNALYLAQEGIRTMTLTTLKPFLITAAAVTLLATPLLAPGPLHSADPPVEVPAVLTIQTGDNAADSEATEVKVERTLVAVAKKKKPKEKKEAKESGADFGGGVGADGMGMEGDGMMREGVDFNFIDVDRDAMLRYASLLQDRPTPEQIVQDLRLEFEELKARRDYQKVRSEALTLAAKAKQDQAAALKAASLKGIAPRQSSLESESEAVMARAEQLLSRAEMIAIERQMLQVTRRLERAVQAVKAREQKRKKKTSKAVEGLGDSGASDEFGFGSFKEPESSKKR